MKGGAFLFLHIQMKCLANDRQKLFDYGFYRGVWCQSKACRNIYFVILWDYLW